MAEITEADKELEDLLEKLIEKFCMPRIDYLSRGTWRVWMTGYHIHTNVGTYGDLVAYGSNLLTACRSLLELDGKYQITNFQNCDSRCPNYLSD